MSSQEQPWWAAFPEPKAPCHALEPDDVKALLEAHSSADNRSFLLVDVRRTDWEGGTVATSINLPAHSLYQTRPVIHQLCKQAGVKTIIFYCGSSRFLSLQVQLTDRHRQFQWPRPSLRRLDAGLPQ